MYIYIGCKLSMADMFLQGTIRYEIFLELNRNRNEFIRSMTNNGNLEHKLGQTLLFCSVQKRK